MNTIDEEYQETWSKYFTEYIQGRLLNGDFNAGIFNIFFNRKKNEFYSEEHIRKNMEILCSKLFPLDQWEEK